MSEAATSRVRSKSLLIIGVLLIVAAAVVLGVWGKREADFRELVAQKGGGPETKIVSGGTRTFEQVMENGRWKLVRVDRGSEGEVTQILLYSGAILGLAGIGVTALGWLGRRRAAVP
jgi:hypothetical protein